MTPELSKKVSEAWEQFLEQPAEQRETWLEQLRSGDAEVAAEVEALLVKQTNRLASSSVHLLPTPVEADKPDTVDYVSQAGSVDSQRTTDYAPPTADTMPAQISRYRIDAKLGEGGMGIVYRGRDADLNRYLAVKVVKEGRQHDVDLCRRFLEEAQVMAGLQHPGIAPIHEIGTLDDGRPFFSMKQIQGHTLAGLLKKRKTPGTDLPRFVGIFEQICQTLAYAHSQGIIHRDLKPANIMVGAFGEVQVMDWGLAKHITQQTTATAIQPHKPEASARHLPHDGTQTGVAMGTIPYMAPEQARGEIANLDERADVFGLGATLCVILTGKPPFHSTNHGEVMIIARSGTLADAFTRLDCCGADGELIALCKTCLAANKEDRPRDGAAVAEAVAAYQEGVQEKLRQAELKQVAAEVKSEEERKRRQVWLALAGVVLMTFVLGAGGGLWFHFDRAQLAKQREIDRALKQQKENERLRQLSRDTERSLLSARDFVDRLLFADAHQALHQAVVRFRPGDLPSLKTKVEKWRQHHKLIAMLDQIRLDKSIKVEGTRFNFVAADNRYGEALRKAGFGEVETEHVAIVSDRIARSPFKKYLVGAFEDWAATTAKPSRHQWLVEILCRVDPHPLRNRFRRLGHQTTRTALTQALAKVDVTELSVNLVLALAHRIELPSPEAVTFLERAHLHHEHDFWLNFELGNALNEINPTEAVSYFLTALTLRRRTAPIHNNLGLAYYYEKKKLNKAIWHLTKAITLDPNDAIAHSNLGAVHAARNDMNKTITWCTKAIALDPNFALAHTNLGTAYHAQKAWDKAIKHLSKAIALDPESYLAHYNLGNSYYDTNQLEKAIAHFTKAILLKPNLAQAHTNLGIAYRRKNDLAKSTMHFTKAIHFDPTLFEAHFGLGHALFATKNLKGAIAAWRKAVALNPRFAMGHGDLGVALYRTKDFDGATMALRKAIALDPHLGTAHGALGQVLRDQGRFIEAVTSFQRALKLLPVGQPLHTFAQSQLRDCQRLLALEKKLSFVLTNPQANITEQLQLADLCQRYLNRYRDAATLYTAAFTAAPKLARDLNRQFRYNAACAAARAAAGDDITKLSDKEFGELRRQTLGWLQADVSAYRKLLAAQPRAVVLVHERLQHWRDDADLTTVRDEKALAKLPDTERRDWRKLWSDVSKLQKKARSSYVEKNLSGTLANTQRQQRHEVSMLANKMYVITMQSKHFDTLLRLEDAKRKRLAENDDIDYQSKNLNSRITFTPKQGGTYQIIATSYQQKGRGAYEIVIHEFSPSGTSPSKRTLPKKRSPGSS